MTRNRFPLPRLFALALGWVLLAGGPAAFGQTGSYLRSSPKVLEAFRAVVEKPSRSTVAVLCDEKQVALGTVVGADGWVLTKASELKGPAVVKLKDGRTFKARVVGVQDKYDLALLKVVASGLTPVEWRDSKSAEVGDWVASPGLGDAPVAVGVVSVATRRPKMADMPPAKKPGGGFLGVQLDPDEDGPKVNLVLPDSGAKEAGVKKGDLVLAVGGRKVIDVETLRNALQRYKPGEVVVVKVKRGNKTLALEAKLGKAPSTRGDLQNGMGSALSDRRGGFPEILQNDQVLKPTDCGGPVVDLDGKVVGVNITRAGRTESYALPSESVRRLLADLKSGRLAPKREELPATPEAARKAVEAARALVQAAEKKMGAAEAGLERARKALKKLKEAVSDTGEEKEALEKARKAFAAAQAKWVAADKVLQATQDALKRAEDAAKRVKAKE